MKTIRTAKRGKLELRLVEKAGLYIGVAIADAGGRVALIDGIDLEDVWQRLQGEAAKSARGYVGFVGARSRFIRFCPDGFSDQKFALHERNYKLAAKLKLDSSVPLEEVAAGRGGFGEAVLSVFHATNLLAPMEKAKLPDMLRGPSADALVSVIARFALASDDAALHEMNAMMKPYDCAKWTIATYLPFLWRPDTHMFLKPQVTQEFATRVGHPFVHDYKPQLDMDVYRSLLDLVRQTERELVTASLPPRDHIDIQSFVWVVGGYDELAPSAQPEYMNV